MVWFNVVKRLPHKNRVKTKMNMDLFREAMKWGLENPPTSIPIFTAKGLNDFIWPKYVELLKKDGQRKWADSDLSSIVGALLLSDPSFTAHKYGRKDKRRGRYGRIITKGKRFYAAYDWEGFPTTNRHQHPRVHLFTENKDELE